VLSTDLILGEGNLWLTTGEYLSNGERQSGRGGTVSISTVLIDMQTVGCDTYVYRVIDDKMFVENLRKPFTRQIYLVNPRI